MKKRDIGGFLKKIGLGGLSIAAELDPTGIAKKIASRIPGLADIIEDNTITDQEAYTRAISSNPDLMRELRAIEAEEFRAKVDALMALEAAETERIRIGVEDTKSAREMRIKTGDRFPNWLAGGTIIFSFLLLVALIFREVPAENEQLFNIGFGAVLGVLSSVYAFYFGSSQGSKNKDATMDRILNHQPASNTFKPNV